MNLSPTSFSNNPFCAGCLSSDRKLTNLETSETRAIYCSFIWDNSSLEEPSFMVCFECKATLLRIVNFKKQVKVAHNGFLFYLNNGLIPECLSKLSIKNNSIINNDPNEAFHILKNEDFSDISNCNSNKKETDVANVIKNQSDTNENDKIVPVFVKMENKVEELFLEDNFENDNTENIEVNVKMEDNFQDSDDEPLSNVKKKKKRKKKKIKKGVRKSSKALQGDRSYVVYNTRVERKLKQLNVDRGLIEMVVLSWDEVKAERLEALKSDAYTKLQYRCEDCALGFNHRAKMDAHMNKHSPEAGDVVCNICKIRFKNEKSLYAHKRRHRVRWRCTAADCGRAWSRAAVCADHAARAHGLAAPTHTCTRCTHTATTLGKLKLHMRCHSEPVSCEICGKTYRDKDTLRTHLFIHKGEKEYECSKCEKKFLFKKALEIHELTHGGNQYLYCHQCDVTFKNHLSYYQHMKYNLKHVDPEKIIHECPHCGARFARASRLHEHTRAVHDRRRHDVRCTHTGCDKAFKSRGSLRSHRATAHRRDLSRVPTHVCHTCGHRYKSKKSLESHVRSHTGERPYACSVSPCTATFAHDAALYRHLKLVHKMTTKKKQVSQTDTTNSNVD